MGRNPHFGNAHQLESYLGLVPGERSSAGAEEIVPLVPKKWLGQILVAVLVAAAEVVLSESTRKKKR